MRETSTHGHGSESVNNVERRKKKSETARRTKSNRKFFFRKDVCACLGGSRRKRTRRAARRRALVKRAGSRGQHTCPRQREIVPQGTEREGGLVGNTTKKHSQCSSLKHKAVRRKAKRRTKTKGDRKNPTPAIHQENEQGVGHTPTRNNKNKKGKEPMKPNGR